MQLPVFAHKDEILRAIQKNSVVIVTGETGSGKTTQIPQFIAQCSWLPAGKIAVTQPRRVAATSLAHRISQEMGVRLGEEVGYAIRFDDRSSYKTKIKLLTDGMLLRELLGDATLSQYTFVILDEAHERSLRTDILFGVLRRLLEGPRSSSLKVIVMSATLNAAKFCAFFEKHAPATIHIAGRTFPVRLFYTTAPQADYLDAAVVCVFQVHQEMAAGDILVFLSGQEEIEAAQKLISDNALKLPRTCDRLLIVPIFAALPTAQQMAAFETTPRGFRKIILATNIAETSITLPGVTYVIDAGVVKVRQFMPRSGVESLAIVPISRSSADQRTGRAGRHSPGVCYRLYTEEYCVRDMQPDAEPEIRRTNLANVMLTMKAFGIEDVVNFPYVDAPQRESLRAALEELFALEALDERGALTPLGRRMAEIPLSPSFAKALIKSVDYGVACEVIDVIAAMSVESLFFVSWDDRERISQIKFQFSDASGDHITMLNVLRAYLRNAKAGKHWAAQNCIHERNVRNALDIRSQLQTYCVKNGLCSVAADAHTEDVPLHKVPLVLKSMLCGFFAQTAIQHPDQTFKTIASKLHVNVHPTSVLFGRKKGITSVMFGELAFTTKAYMKGISCIEPLWLTECAPKYFGNVFFEA